MVQARTSIDLNADLGEGGLYDAQMLSLVSSANIACGGHAGDLQTMRTAVSIAQEAGVAIGAHPSYPDRENFGRKLMSIPAEQLLPELKRQVESLQNVADSLGQKLSHIKPHGALYNQAAFDTELGELVIRLVQEIDPSLHLMVLAASPLARRARLAGINVIEEAFADRAYRSDASLVPRTELGAVLESPDLAVAQCIRLVREGQILSINKVLVPVSADSICVHGDGIEAFNVLKQVREAILIMGVRIAPHHQHDESTK
ncbi:5-oxoprolinase subunit PxpA [Undibacterium cyanobacteriorum]|uniref:5-oxoprolinase subunit PxpA n=1 Tax=Undibacterium cyanobacteriorum TaxID=3073561 RepID=A0ABY9RH56_9BURK|nr:5-oxoprolinase subunit PxpA [Undibacterium sp. 20NA77.5]WMW79989.1 5-oxoprolinase subunit PxpA [Undibacterium sp. 20NA77.5]